MLTVAIGYIGILSEKINESIEVMEIVEASKRLYGLAKFTFSLYQTALQRFSQNRMSVSAVSSEDQYNQVNFLLKAGRKMGKLKSLK